MTKSKIRQAKIKSNSIFQQDQILILKIHLKRINFMTMLLKELINFKQDSLIDKLSLRWTKRQENKENISKSKVKKDKRKEKKNGMSFLSLKEILGVQINLNLPLL